MDNRERLENYAAGAATRYWCSLLRQVRAGKDLASQHQWRFLANNERSRGRLSREFYSEAHLTRLTALNRRQVVESLSPWLDSAVDWALEWEEDKPAAQRRLLTSLVRSQYVVTVREGYGKAVTNVDGHPNEEVLYGDLYEMSAAGVSSGGFIYLFNATGEPFAARDRQVTFNGMKQEFYANAASDGSEADWDFEWFFDHDDVRAIVAGVLHVYSEDDD